MNELTTFQFQPGGVAIFNTIRTVNLDGEPWFVARDVADVLGYARPRDAIRAHCKGAVLHRILTDGGEQEMTVIPERDLYRLVMRSTLPSAERFEEWVVGTVLPAIRKTGSYVKGEEALDPAAPDYLDRLKDLLLEAQERKLAAAEAKIAVLAPKAEALERLSASEGSMTLSNAARNLGIAERTFFKWLTDNGWIFRAKGKANGNRPVPYADKRNEGLMEVVTSTFWQHGEEVAVQSCYVTAKGIAKLAEVVR